MQSENFSNEQQTELNGAQRYVKLTRALVLSRILQGATELNEAQREKMEKQLQEIRSQLGFTLQEFQQILQDMEKNPKQDISEQLDGTSFTQKMAFCINRQCRHRFVATISVEHPSAKRCPLCQSLSMFVTD